MHGRTWFIDEKFWTVPLGNVQIEFFHFPSTLRVPRSKDCWKACLSNITLDTQVLSEKINSTYNINKLLLCKPLSIPSCLSFSSSPPRESSWQVTFKATQWLFSHSSQWSHMQWSLSEGRHSWMAIIRDALLAWSLQHKSTPGRMKWQLGTAL